MEKKEKDYQQISTAYHEATHALFVLLSYFKIEKVSILPDENKENYETCGITSFFSPLNYTEFSSLKKKFAISELIINYSGVVGEQFLFKEISGLDKAPSYINKSGYFDNNNSKIIIKKFLKESNISTSDFKKRACLKIESILKIYWEDVKIIARALLKKKTLDYKDLKKELIKKSKNIQQWKQRFKVIEHVFDSKNLLSNESLLLEAINFQEKLW